MTKMYKFPKLLGTCVDRLEKLQHQIDEATQDFEARVRPFKEEYAALEAHLIETIPKAKLDGALGKTAMATLERATFPTVKDWPKFYTYIAKHEAWELLQKRPAVGAFRERWANKEVVPGTEMFVKLSLNLKSRKAT